MVAGFVEMIAINLSMAAGFAVTVMCEAVTATENTGIMVAAVLMAGGCVFILSASARIFPRLLYISCQTCSRHK